MSTLKQVLNRRLFRHGGMLGPENPQGILNSSPELADVVRMRDGGMTMASGPEAFSKFFRDTQFPVPGLPSEFLLPSAEPFIPSDIVSDLGLGPETVTALLREVPRATADDRTAYRQAYPDMGPASDLSEAARDRAYLDVYNALIPEQRGRVEELVAQGVSNKDAITKVASDVTGLGERERGERRAVLRELSDLDSRINEAAPDSKWALTGEGVQILDDPRRAFTLEALRSAELSGELGAEQLRKAFFPSAFIRGSESTVVEDEAGDEPTVVEDEAGGESTVVEDEDGDILTIHINSGTREGTGAVVEGGEPSVASTIAEVLGDPDQPIENKKKTIADYKQEFIDALPEYQGQTQFEKGMTLAKFGAAIMAGESPRAIKNIGDAFLAMAPEFTKDAEGKRAFEQAIELSSAKYSLAQINKDLDRDREDERAFHYFYDPEDPSNMEILTTADLVAGIKPGPNMVEGEIAKSILTLQGVKAKAQQDLIANANLTEPERKRYTREFRDAAEAVTRANMGKGLLQGVMEGISRGGGPVATGALGFASQLSDMVQNVFNINKTDYQADGGPVSREAMLADIRKAFQLLIPITVGASQSANSISDRDVSILSRAVVANILEEDVAVGDLLTGSTQVLFDKMQYSYNLFDDSLKKANLQMESLDNQFQNKLDYTYGGKGGVEARLAGVLVDPYRPQPESAPTSGQIIKWQDFVNKPQWQEYSTRVGYNPAQYDPGTTPGT